MRECAHKGCSELCWRRSGFRGECALRRRRSCGSCIFFLRIPPNSLKFRAFHSIFCTLSCTTISRTVSLNDPEWGTVAMAGRCPVHKNKQIHPQMAYHRDERRSSIMKKMLKAAAVLAAMVMALTLGACSDGDDGGSSSGSKLPKKTIKAVYEKLIWNAGGINVVVFYDDND